MPEYALQGKAEMGDYFFLSLFDVYTVDSVTVCVVMDKTCVLMFVLECVCVCVCLKQSVLFWEEARQAAGWNWREWLWPSDKIKSKVFSVSIVFSTLLHIVSSQPNFPSLLYLFLPSALQNRAAKKKFFICFPPFSSFVVPNHLQSKTVMAHIVQCMWFGQT